MGSRGFAATPLKILEARGSKAKYKRKGEPAGPPGAPKFPPGWPESRRPCWDSVLASLSAMGILSSADGGVIENYVIAVERRDWADSQLRDDDRYTETETGKILPSAATVELDKAIDLMTRLGARLGLSPADRAAVRGSQVAQPVADAKSRFFSA